MKKLFRRAASALVLPLLLLFAIIASGCTRPRELPRIAPMEGITLPAISALAFNSDGTEIVSLSETGELCRWDTFRGRLLACSRADGSGADLPLSLSGSGREFPVLSPDGTKKISPSGDGAVCLFDAASGKELARYYCFNAPSTPPDNTTPDATLPEWISITPEGYYNASFLGPSFLEAIAGKRRYKLLQLSGALFRPDLFEALVSGSPGGENSAGKNSTGEKSGSEKPRLSPAFQKAGTLETLMGEDRTPPAVSLSYNEGQTGNLTIKITLQKGGAGRIALYRRSTDSGLWKEDMPAGLFDAEKRAGKKITEKGMTSYEITLTPEPGEIGVSAFNKYNTVESGRYWFMIPGESRELLSEAKSSPPPLPALKVLLASGTQGAARDSEAALEQAMLLQAKGNLYSAVEVKSLFDKDFSLEAFNQTLERFCAGANKNDVIVLCLRGRAQADTLGDLRIFQEQQGNTASEPEITGDDILQKILPSAGNPLILLDLEGTKTETETALFRFRQRLGPRAMLAAALPAAMPPAVVPPDPGKAGTEVPFVRSIIEGLGPDFSGAGEVRGENRYIGAAKLLARAGGALARQGIFFLSFPPGADFNIADSLANAGELKFQTMASGMLKIDQVDKTPVPLNFGATMVRTLPPGSYIIDMVYRNGYKETRMVDLKKKQSTWVIFNYTPPLITGDASIAALSRMLPSLGINLSELNPSNYEKVNQEAMEGMGMAPYYVAFLSGEKLYKAGNYDKAIAEYSRSISLKADYADAYASRGNARRKKGELDRAIEDYTRALNLKNASADVYNYRGYVYAQKGDLNRAIADYTQAIRYRANYGDAYFNRAYAYGKQEKWGEAIADYTQVIKLEPSNAAAYNQRGNAWYNKGDKTKAAADFAAAEKLR
ncbi:MAG: tetratricopeptide repeat protein [Treponema sp.]|nr:tetratricopeptide repeat protein [Treponema sp.]